MLESLFLIGFAIVVLPPILEKIHINVRAGEVITGILVAAVAPTIVQQQWIAALAELGLLILMFEIGLDIDVDRVKDRWEESLKYATVSFFVPATLLFITLYAWLMQPYVALLIAVGLSSTAMAVVSPLMDRRNIDSTLIKDAAMFSEMIGISLLVAFVQGQNAPSGSLITQAFAIFGFVMFAIFIVPRLVDKLKFLSSKSAVNVETKLVLFIVIALALVSEQLGTHAATGAFMAGLFFSESTHRGLQLEERISPIADLMVPIFFFRIGTQLPLTAVTRDVLLAAAGMAVLVHGIRLAAFRGLATVSDIVYDFEKINLFAPCITITATAASIGLSMGVLSTELFATFLTAGLTLTVLGPFASRLASTLR
ncbi:MAG: cation:proton antiporter [Candidatus Nanohaloarchaea archaeon]|nr:cation:proton antiporter [Candidatus Nanohaloarchaea archaeon]